MNASHSAALPDHAALQRAAQWYATLMDEPVSDSDRAAWQAWLAERAEHQHAWRYIEAVSRRFAPLQGAGERHAASAALRAPRGGANRTRRQALNALALMMGGGIVGWGAWRSGALPASVMAWAAQYRSGVGEVRHVVLEDGSELWLATRSACDVEYTAGVRRLTLVAGECLIQTAADAARAFVVDCACGRLQALGTRFSVREGEDDASGERVSHLAVFDGAVRIHTAGSGHMRVLRAGEQARFSARRIEPSQAISPHAQAWSRGLLVAEDMPLSELVAELARYRHGHLAVAPEVARLRVAGVFPLTDSERALDMLTAALPVRLARPLPWWVTVESNLPG
ncbi:MAG: FecR family protein [Rhodocyclaceae bacterium]